MPIITDYTQVKEIYSETSERGIALPTLCAEDRETLEAILASALEMGKITGIEDIPIIPAWTCRYPPRGQMKLLTACGDPILGINLMLSDLKAFMGQTSPYRKLRVLPHLDHAFPWLDGDILEKYVDCFASVMCDASEKPFEENIRLTAQYAEKVKGKVVVEGAVDEIFEAGSNKQKNKSTTVEQSERFLAQTGVDIIVPNVGTEHRATVDSVKYCGNRAREISKAVGSILCLHGTSSLKPEDINCLPDDGFIKVNIYTSIAVHGGQAVAYNVLNNLENIFSENQLKDLINQKILGGNVPHADSRETCSPIKPKLKYVTNPPRRNAWFSAVRDQCCYFLEHLNYRQFQK